ncbi:unnamed protein product [Urochloa humidicola]
MAADQQPPGEEAAAMVDDDQKPAIEAAARYPVGEVAEAVAFVEDLTARLQAFPGIRDGLLVGLGEGRGGDGDPRGPPRRAPQLHRLPHQHRRRQGPRRAAPRRHAPAPPGGVGKVRGGAGRRRERQGHGRRRDLRRAGLAQPNHLRCVVTAN